MQMTDIWHHELMEACKKGQIGYFRHFNRAPTIPDAKLPLAAHDTNRVFIHAE
jgi:hypothetical protein